MKIQQATEAMLPAVRRITQETIGEIYPHYYPAGAVALFQQYHADDSILADLRSGRVYLLTEGGEPVATVTVNGSHILRLFVLKACQHRGFGKVLLDFAEAKIAESFPEAEVDASLPAKHIYLQRGYREVAYHKLQAENGDVLCYDVMRKTF